MTICPNVLEVINEHKQYVGDDNNEQAEINNVLDKAHNINEIKNINSYIKEICDCYHRIVLVVSILLVVFVATL